MIYLQHPKPCTVSLIKVKLYSMQKWFIKGMSLVKIMYTDKQWSWYNHMLLCEKQQFTFSQHKVNAFIKQVKEKDLSKGAAYENSMSNHSNWILNSEFCILNSAWPITFTIQCFMATLISIQFQINVDDLAHLIMQHLGFHSHKAMIKTKLKSTSGIACT